MSLLTQIGGSSGVDELVSKKVLARVMSLLSPRHSMGLTGKKKKGSNS